MASEALKPAKWGSGWTAGRAQLRAQRASRPCLHLLPTPHPLPTPPPGKPCITDTAEECQKCLNARLSMVDKRLKPGVWGDPPSYRQAVNPVAMEPSGSQQQQQRGATSWAPLARAAGGRRGLHTAAPAAQQAAQQQQQQGGVPAAAARAGALFGGAVGPAAGSDVPRTNIGIFGCMNAGKSSLMNRITRR